MYRTTSLRTKGITDKVKNTLALCQTSAGRESQSRDFSVAGITSQWSENQRRSKISRILFGDSSLENVCLDVLVFGRRLQILTRHHCACVKRLFATWKFEITSGFWSRKVNSTKDSEQIVISVHQTRGCRIWDRWQKVGDRRNRCWRTALQAGKCNGLRVAWWKNLVSREQRNRI
jgi:hypothetical protein